MNISASLCSALLLYYTFIIHLLHFVLFIPDGSNQWSVLLTVGKSHISAWREVLCVWVCVRERERLCWCCFWFVFSTLKIKQQKLKQGSSLSLSVGVCYVNVSRPVWQTESTPEEDTPQQPCFHSQVVSDLLQKQSHLQWLPKHGGKELHCLLYCILQLRRHWSLL